MKLLRNVFKQISALLMIAVLSISFIAPTHAQAAYAVSSGSVFNNPYGTKSQRWAIIDQVESAIDNTPKGEYIRIATFSIRHKASADKLIAADKRGVIVQIVTDDHLYDEDDTPSNKDTAQLDRIKKALGTKVTANASYLKVCNNSCMSNVDWSSEHAKIYLFSRAGGSKWVSMIGSSNLSEGHTTSWNNLYKVVGDADYYTQLKDYFNAMSKEPDKGDWYTNEAFGKYRLYLFPRKVDNVNDDVYYSMLNKVQCTGASTGYGSKGKTVIDLAMFQWSDRRDDVANKLVELKKQGCVIKVATSASLTYKSILTTLIKGGIAVRDEDKWDSSHKNLVHYMHHKYITINGYYQDPSKTDAQNRKTKIVFTGSPNLTDSGLRFNNEVLVRIDDATQYAKYTSNFNLLYNKYGRTIKLGEGFVPIPTN